jgi:Ribbon-helix-helix protein, copG family
MHMSLTRRTQLLLDEARYERLRAEAEQSGRSVGSIIREAIDERLARDDERRREAGRRLLSAPRPTDPEPDWDDVKPELLDQVYGGVRVD